MFYFLLLISLALSLNFNYIIYNESLLLTFCFFIFFSIIYIYFKYIFRVLSQYIPASNLILTDESDIINSMGLIGLGDTDIALLNWQNTDILGIFCSTDTSGIRS